MPEPRIPTEVTIDDYLTAMEPLFALLNVSPGEIVGDIAIVQTPSAAHSVSLSEIRFNVVAHPADDDSEVPAGFPNDGHPQGDEFAVWEHRINVAVI